MAAWGSTHLSMGRFKHPGPGFLPFGLGLCLIILSLILIFKNLGRSPFPLPFWPQRTWLRPMLGLVILTFYAFFINHLGFILTTFIFLMIWMGLIERLRKKTVLIISLGTTAALYLLFVFFLEIPLPLGFLKW
ncbi:MAG: tripartite tricarboxylate transporter TctB family protein [Deltaproteobacteria bacterium]|nr:tripartite tricarboxylate transporter TctB family protein [Deltaproteobacteria bacterium]